MAAIPTPEYYITEASFEAEAGDNISAGVNPTVTLVITPATGYTLTSTNFSIGNALPAEVASAVFSQDGANVNCLITFDAGFVMPSSNIELLIDIDGVADEQTYTIDGEYTIKQLNVQESSTTPIAFSQSGVDGAEITLFTKTFTATTNYHFEEEPYWYESLTNTRIGDGYIVTYVDTTTAGNTPSDTLLTARTYTVKYIINGQSKTLNDINFVANAVEFFPLPTTAVLKSYKISTDDFSEAGESRYLELSGDAGASFTLNIDIDGINADYTLTLEDSGSLQYQLIANPNSSGLTKVYTYTFSGNIESPFGQTNPIVINQPSS